MNNNATGELRSCPIMLLTKLLFLTLAININLYAMGLSESQALDSAIPNPVCDENECHTPAKVMWGSIYYTEPLKPVIIRYYSDHSEAMLYFYGGMYEDIDEFCKTIPGLDLTTNPPRCGGSGAYTGASPNQDGISEIMFNDTEYFEYRGNCGATCYGNPDYRGRATPRGFCPKGYSFRYPGSKMRTSGGDSSRTGRPGCYKAVLAPDKPKTPPAPPLCEGAPGEGAHAGNPILISLGTKSQRERDYTSSEFNIVRTYSSSGVYSPTNVFGKNWHYHENRKIQENSINQIAISGSNGAYYLFDFINEEWKQEADVNDSLVEVTDEMGEKNGWKYIDNKKNIISHYDIDGFLISEENRSGRVIFYENSDSGLLQTITNDLGQQLKFYYEAETDHISNIRLQDGSYIEYTYSNQGNLKSITYPDGMIKTYHYGEEDSEAALVSATPATGIDYKHALTGITDELGVRFATWSYDDVGRAISSEHANGVEKTTLFYNAPTNTNEPTSTVVTDGRGTNRTYNFTTILGVVKSTGSDQPAGAGCAASGSNITYDANGNVDTKTDFNGNLTQYHYDMARNLETTRVEGLDTAGNARLETRTITTSWHPDWRLPEVISEYSGDADSDGTPLGTLLRQTTTAYDDKGNITSITINDPINNTIRRTTTNYTYSTGVPGLILSKVVDGPRTDISDITTYDYYPHDATCADSTATPIIDPITGVAPPNLGCRGQLQMMTNALGHQTTYDRYNHHGQLEQMTDPNGLITEYTYDLRQRMTSHTKGTELTNYQYDAVGQLDILTLPDGSQLDYDYDAAHRLTDIRDNQGNHIHYTLDSMGNRTQEDTKDPQGTLTKTLTRGYDALNRLETLTGIE